jgi:hypothetical protein
MLIDDIAITSTLGITGKNAEDIPWIVYPNPAGDHVILDFRDAGIRDPQITVKNNLGQTVKTVPVGFASGKINVDVSDLYDGVYFISVRDDGKTEVRKLVVSHE